MREHRHILAFEVPGLEPGEDLHSAQLRLTLAFVDWQHQLRTGTVFNLTAIDNK